MTGAEACVALSAFEDKSAPPSARDLTRTLGRTSKLWNGLKRDLQRQHGPLAEEWSFAGAKYGWSLRLKQEKRVLVYLTPCQDHFLAAVVLGNKAVQALEKSDLSPKVKSLIAAAKVYAEGRGVRLEIHDPADAGSVRTMAAAKVTAT
jgi:hypothetical protein